MEKGIKNILNFNHSSSKRVPIITKSWTVERKHEKLDSEEKKQKQDSRDEKLKAGQ